MTNENMIPERFYFHGNEIEQFIHIQVPIALIKDKMFKGISTDAKLLYGLLLNRTGLSIKNQWLDADNRTYITYTIENVMEDMGIGSTKAKKLFAELVDINDTGIGLIKKVRVLNKPSRIYVLNFTQVFEYLKRICGEEQENSGETHTENKIFSESYPQNEVDHFFAHSETSVGETSERPTDGHESDFLTDTPASTDYNNIRDKDNIDINSINPSFSDRSIDGNKCTDISNADYLAYKQLIMDNIGYDELVNCIDIGVLSNDSLEHLNEIVELMTEIVSCTTQPIKINGNSYPAEIVKSRFLKLDYNDIYAVLEWFEKPNADGSNLIRVKNMRAYLISMLFNSKTTRNTDFKNYFNASYYGNMGKEA
ncbi:MAG: replication initiator protein A [Firmicutes bacterium]|nr:replication initiator protein A [Bacillota bacterium]